METAGGQNSNSEFSAKTNEELLKLASIMYSLGESARSLLTDELQRRSIGPDEIQSYIDSEAAKTSKPDPSSHLFAWIWPAIEDEKTAADASARAILFSALVTFFGIVGSVVHLPGLFSLFLADKTDALKLLAWVALTVLWASVHRGIVNESPAWATVGLLFVVAWPGLALVLTQVERGSFDFAWKRPDTLSTCLYLVILAAFISSVRGTTAYRKHAESSGNQMYTT